MPPSTSASANVAVLSSVVKTIDENGREVDLKRKSTKDSTDFNKLKVDLHAELDIQGEGATKLAQSTSVFFHDFLNALSNTKRRHSVASQDEELDDFHRHIAANFHSHLTGVLAKQQSKRGSLSDVQMMTSPSGAALMMDFSNAQGLLSHGVESYIGAVRKLLRSGGLEDAVVDVALRGYSFSALDESIGKSGNQEKDTVGQKCLTLFCGLCYLAYDAASRTKERRRHAHDLEAGLLSRDSSEDLSPRIVSVLKDVTCLIKPGRLTLVLGPPGSGKTSFLRAISGQLLREPGKTFTQGELAYNGRSVASLKNLPNWVAYASQNDEHMPLLTVRETLDHAFKCRKEIRYSDPVRRSAIEAKLGPDGVERLEAFKALDVDVALAVLGLTRCANTVIGNETLKGVSGGERRRVTLGEMLAVGTQILALDEISTGLDSAATFDICSYLRTTAHIMDQCVVVALLQPPPETVNLFDDAIILAEGQIIYHGEVKNMLDYFEGLGFRKPARKDVGDFLVELPTPTGKVYRLSLPELKELGLLDPPITASDFAARWRISEAFKSEDAQVLFSLSRSKQSTSAPLSASGIEASTSPLPLSVDFDALPQNPWYVQLNLALSWMWTYRIKDKVKLKTKIIQNIFMGCLFGTLFFQIPKDEAYQKNILILNVLMFTSQTAIPEVAANARARAVYHKHIDQGFYKAWMLSLAQTITSLPFVLADVLIFGQLIYWLTGLSQHFFSFALYFVGSTLFGATMQNIMGLFPYFIRDEMKATIAAVLVLIVSILLSGVIATEGVIPFYLKPIFNINPFAWAFRSLANVEFLSPDYDVYPCVVSLNGKSLTIPQRCGDFFLSSREIRAGWNYVWGGFLVLVVYLVVFWSLTAAALTFVRFAPLRGKKPNVPVASAVSDYESPQSSTYRADALLTRPVPPLLRQNSLASEPVALVVHELSYAIPNPSGEKGATIDLLKGISCFAMPGRMLALMGSSGAGKTTLLDVLAGIKNVGKARGQIFLNGLPLKQSDFTRIAGYVQQFGVHSNTSTIRESLEFSMALRLPRSSVVATDAERASFIDKQLDLLELNDIQDQLAGHCSMEQNKRLTLGVELVANPSIVFADEPTSGLDARAASIVMRVLQKVARSGRVVVATIHQPSVQVFNRFDDLLLLKRGGQIVFFGELGVEAKSLISYFESIPGVPSCPEGTNPAAWMLDVIGGGTGIRQAPRPPAARSHSPGGGSSTTQSTSGDDADSNDDNEYEVPPNYDDLDYPAVYRNSALKRMNDERIRLEFRISQSVLDKSIHTERKVKGSTQFTTSFLTQYQWVLKRNFAELWRSPDFSFLRFVVVTLFAGIFVSIFFQQKVENMADMQSRILCITFSMSLSAMFTMMTIIPFSINRRALFYRERGSGMYHAVVFSMAAGVSEIPYLLVTAGLTVNIVYWGVGFENRAFPFEYFFLLTFLFYLLMAFVGMLMSNLAPDPLTAQISASAFFSISNMFAGISVPVKLIPKPYLFIHYGSPLRYFFEGLLSTQFHGNDDVICNPLGKPVMTGLKSLLKLCTVSGAPDDHISGLQVTVEDFVLHDFLDGYDYDRRYIDVAVLLGWILILRVLALLAQVFISFEKR